MRETGHAIEALLKRLRTAPPSARLDIVREAGPPDDVLVALGDEAERLVVVEVRQALAASDLVVELADELGNPLARARARRAKAQALALSGSYEESLALCGDAAEIASSGGFGVEAARARLASLNSLAHLGRFEEAIAAGGAARAAFLSEGEIKLAARADLNLGATHRMMDSQAEAIVHYDRAREALLDEPAILAQLDSNRGIALMYLDEFVRAEAAFQSAADAFRAADMNAGAAIVEGNLADLAGRQGRFGAALEHFERARYHLERDDAPGHVARLAAERADTLAALGLWEDARRGYADALEELEEEGVAQWAAQARAGLGRVLLNLGRLDDAQTQLELCAAAFERLGQRTSYAEVELVRGELLLRRGSTSEARLRFRSALPAFDDRPTRAALARYRLAHLAYGEGDFAGARENLGPALVRARSLDVAPLLADLLHLLALIRLREDDPRGALEDLRSAVSEVERLRGSLQAERFRAAVLGDRFAVYEDLASVALDHGERGLEEAFRAIELAKSRSLLDRVSGALDLEEAAHRAGPDEALVSELASLRATVNWHYSRLAPEGLASGAGTEGERTSAVQACERRLDELEDRLAVSRGVAGLYARPIELADLQSRLDGGEALVEYFSVLGELAALVVTREGTRVFRNLSASAELNGRIQRLQFQLQRALRCATRGAEPSERHGVDARRELHRLWSTLWEPLEPSLASARRVVVVPHGPLHTVPFPALWTGDRHVIEDFEFSFSPSASVYARLAATADPPSGPPSALVVGVADDLAPAIEAEARTVAESLAGVRFLRDREATRARVIEAAADARVVHLACHGRFVPSRPLASGLRLADGWLTARDACALQLESSLVVLSGCATGGNAVEAGDELVGLLRGFLAGGARSVVVSLWSLNDESATELMTSFHREIASGDRAASALRSAQLELMRSKPHPVFWAPFILGGGS